MATNKSPLTPPGKSGADRALSVAKAGISLVPWLGSATVEMLDGFFDSPHESKLHLWREAIAKALADIQRDVASLRADVLQRDGTFQRAVLLASEIASRSEPAETYAMLSRALVSAADPRDSSHDLMCRILATMKLLLPSHVILLTYFANREYVRETIERTRQHLQKTFPGAMDEDVEEYGRIMPAYRIACHGIDCLDLPRAETKIFIDDLIHEGLLVRPDDHRHDESPVTTFGHKLLAVLTQP